MCGGEEHHEGFHGKIEDTLADEEKIHEMIKKKLMAEGKTEEEAERAIRKWDQAYGKE